MVRVGVGYWNDWRRTNPGIQPDVSHQGLSLEDPDPPYPLERKDTLSYLPRINFANANLAFACLYFSHLEQASFRGANLQNANLCECDLSRADFTGANLKDADISGSSLAGANLTDVTGLTDEQLASAGGDSETGLPPGIKRPTGW
jgi:hypothetical protein